MKFVLSAFLAVGFAANSYGSLVLQSTTPSFDVTGSGLGAVNTVLTFQSPANSSTETGCVAYNGTTSVTTGCGFANSTVLNGQSQTNTPTLGSVGISSAANIGLVLNASEPAGNSLGIDQVVLNLYSSTGTNIFSAACSNCNVVAPSTLSGTGSSGFLFLLDSAQAATANTAINNNGGFGSVRIGVGSSLSQATGGNETFYVANVQGQSEPPAGVPEPTTMALMGAGLVGLSLIRKRVRS